MKSIASTCSPERFESFLSGELNSGDESQLTEHLEHCEPCRSRIDSLAAEPQSWQQAQQYLQPTRFQSPFDGDHHDDDNSDEDYCDGRPIQRMSLQVRNMLDSLAPSDDPDMLGRLGTYEISGVIGVGGMGIVLKAFDRSLDRMVAIKVLAPHLASSGAARHRFEREAKAAAAVLHPNVIAIHAVCNDQQLPWLVMPYIRGASLQKRIDENGPLPVGEILRIGSQIASGLADAHSQGLVHRDIKPANVLLEEGVERVTITDFGLARAVDDATMTRSGIIAGTPQYMSPEQARGESVDGRSDLFSLGSVLYAMCTGHSPFRAETTYGVMRRITDDDPRKVQEINPQIPVWLAGIIEKLLNKNPDDRIQSSSELATLLEDCLAHVQQPAKISLPAACLQFEKQSKQSMRKCDRFWRIDNWFAVAIGLVGFLGLFAAAWFTLAEPPEIAGTWHSEDWGTVNLKAVAAGEYKGTYSEVFGDQPGTIDLKWSRAEKRFKGKWRDGTKRFGRISIRVVDSEIRGAWTASKKSEIQGELPRLADLEWTRSESTRTESDFNHDSKQQGDWTVAGADENQHPSIPIPPGYKVIAVKVNSATADANFKNGDIVDLIGIHKASDKDQLIRITSLVYQSAVVFSVANSENGFIASLLVKQQTSEDHFEAVSPTVFESYQLIPTKAWQTEDADSELGSGKRDRTQPTHSIGGSVGVVIDVKDETIAINLGNGDGIKVGAVISISRASQFIGKAVLIRVQDKRAVARLNEEYDASKVKVGDTVWATEASADESIKQQIPSGANWNDALNEELNKRFGSLGYPSPNFEDEMTLADAVSLFNDHYADHPLAKNQPPLTEDEVVASMRWAAGNRQTRLTGMTDKTFEEFQSIYENKVLLKDWQFEILTAFQDLRGQTQNAWTIRISMPNEFIFGIRDQSLFQLYADTELPRPSERNVDLTQLDPDAKGISSAIAEFNLHEVDIDGFKPMPLTLGEVITSIKRAYPPTMPLTNGEYAKFLEIATSQQMPPDYRLEYITSFVPGDGYEYRKWSVRLTFPYGNGEMTYSHSIRNQFLSCKKAEREEGEPVDGAKSGLGSTFDR